MGKNTLMVKCIKDYCEESGDTAYLTLAEKLVGNVGVIFTTGDMSDVRNKISKFVKPAPARQGAVAQADVIIPAGPTGMEPSQTGFFQVLNIATKINKGSVEILSDVVVCKAGDKVTSSAAVLLSKMKMTPFEYGLEVRMVYDKGAMFDVAVLDITDDDLAARFGAGLRNIAALGMSTKYPTVASVPHAIINAYKNVLSISIGTEYTFKLAEKVKEMIKNPGAFAVAAAPAASAGPAAAAKKAPEPEPEEEESDMGFDLFG